jgi:hypothetical protein
MKKKKGFSERPKRRVIEDMLYGGKIVAKTSLHSRRVIAFGTDVEKVSAEAKEKGVKDPIIYRMPKLGEKIIGPLIIRERRGK